MRTQHSNRVASSKAKNILPTVYVPSYKRSDTATTPFLFRRLGFPVVLCVRHGEVDAYHAKFPDVEIMTLPDDLENNGQTRQLIMENVNDPKYLMIDDDIRGFSFKPDYRAFGGLVAATTAQIMRTIDTMMKADAGAIVDRFVIATGCPVEWRKWGFMRQFLYISDKVKKAGIRFDRVPLYVDIDYSLQVLKAGLDVSISRKLCVESPHRKPDASNGGCDVQRVAMQAQLKNGKFLGRVLSENIHRLHPDVVELNPDVKAEHKIHRISWKGAYEIGRGV